VILAWLFTTFWGGITLGSTTMFPIYYFWPEPDHTGFNIMLGIFLALLDVTIMAYIYNRTVLNKVEVK